ncbi:MAG: SpoIIE family protein phosphatase [Candidatus Gracilibacteria bacterium]|nr:SpoIIE family protein phosphatase [Candidatus Gracilibacteria bacterium]MDD2908949.1 SpoIIE family protein phosphatase [Candidatus Gracilibacteria bacterium]
MKIKYKLPILYALIGVIVTLGLVNIFSNSEKTIITNIEDRFIQTINNKSSEIDKFLYDQLVGLKSLSLNSTLQQSISDYQKNKNISSINIENILKDFLIINKTFDYAEIIDASGTVLNGNEILGKENVDKSFVVRESIIKRIGKSDAGEKYYQDITSEIKNNSVGLSYIIEDLARDSDGNTYLTYIVPVLKSNENNEIKLIGIIKARLSIENISNIFVDLPNLGNSLKAYIYNPKGEIISSLDRNNYLTKLSNINASQDNIIKKTLVQEEVLDGDSVVAVYKNMKGYKSFSGLGWTIKMTQSKNELFQSLAGLKQTSIYVVAFIVFSVMFLAAIIQWQFINPLNRLLGKIRKFSTGDDNVVIDIESSDEIGVLAGAFNDMIYKIREKTKILNEYKNVIDATSLVSKVDQSGNFIYVNDIFCNSAGCELKEIIGQPHQIIRHPDIGPEIFKDIEKSMKAKEIWKGVMKNRRKDESEYWLQSVIAPILDMNNNIVEMILIETDITELEKTKQQLEVSYNKLQESTDELVTKERISKEFELATKIQEDFMPRPGEFDIEGVEVHCGLTSATEIGGDLYDIVKSKEDPSKTIFYIGDVTGHGLIAGIMMAICNSLIYSLAQSGKNSIRDIIIKLNNTLFHKLPSKVFITLLLLQYDSATNKLSYAGAGHERLLIYRKKIDEIEEIKTGGSAIGMFADATNDVKVNELNLESGDIVLMYTDGIPEARNPDEQFYGMEKFKQSFKSNAHRNVQAMYEGILKDLYDFINGAEILDDITFFLIRKK